MSPDIDDLVVTFTGSDDAFAVLLLNFLDLLLGGIDFLIFFFGNNHVIDADGDPGLGGLAEAKLFELIEHGDGFIVPANLVALPNEITQFALFNRLVGEAHFFRPDLAENDAAYGGFNDLLVLITEFSFFAEIGIGQANALVGGDGGVAIGEDH